jgi:hypothetical protein
MPGLDAITAFRGEIGRALVDLARLAAWQPFLLCLAAFLLLVLPLSLGARAARRRHEARGIPWGAAWLSSALLVGLPLLVLAAFDALLAAAGLASLEKRFLALFSPALLVARDRGPSGPDLLLATLPSAAALCLVGPAAAWAYVGLFARGGLFVWASGVEASGLMRLAGHWANRGPEKRLGLWAAPLSRAVHGAALLALPAAVAGHLPPTLWVAAAVLSHGFMAAASHALESPPAVGPKAPAPADPAEPPPEGPGASPPSPPSPRGSEDEVARALEANASLAYAQDRLPAAVEVPSTPSADLLRQILGALGVKSLYRHQAKAIDATLGGEHVLLFTPPSSGRKVVRDALALHAVLAEGTSVLYLCRDSAEAERAHALFSARSQHAHWRWNVPALVLSQREELDLDRVQPSIVFASFADAHLRLLGHAARYRFFFRSLTLVAVTHLERYQGPSADHLTYLLARLRRAVREAAGAEGLVAPERPRPRLLLLADPTSPQIRTHAERIAGQRVTPIGEELDGAPVAPMRHVWLTRTDGSAPSAEEAASILRRLGVRWLALGLETELGRPEAQVDRRAAQAVLVRAGAAAVARLPLMLRHYGTEAKVQTVVAYWLAASDPLSRLLPGAKGAMLAKKLEAPRLVTGGSERVARDHAGCALAESDWPLDELEETFGAAAAKAAIASLQAEGQVVLESRCEIRPSLGEVGRRDFIRARRVQPHGKVTLGVVGRALAVQDRSTGEAIAFVPAERALAAAYPERILEHGGRRYRVLPIADQERREQGVLWAEVEMRASCSVPVRRLELEMLPDRRRVHGDVPGIERRAPARRELGGREFALTWPRVRIRERIEGFRNIENAAVRDAGLFAHIVDGSHEGQAAVLAFPAQAGWDVSPGALHALVHLFRSALPAVVQAGPDDLDLVDLVHGGDPAVAFVDLHPGGGGYAEAITLEAVRSLAALSLAIVRGCSCRNVAGCPSCVRTSECRSGFGHLGERVPSRRDAERVLCELLDPTLLHASDAIRYEGGQVEVGRTA